MYLELAHSTVRLLLDFLCVHGTIFPLILFMWGAHFIHTVLFTCMQFAISVRIVQFICIKCYLCELGATWMLTMLGNTHVRKKQFTWIQCIFSTEYDFWKLSLMCFYASLVICVMRFSKLSQKCLAGLVYFHIFPSVVLDFKLFSENVPNKMISKKKISILKKLEIATC